MARLAIPVNVPAGGISRKPVTPRSSMVSMHRSQRTGLAIWPTIRLSTSTPLWTTRPSRLEITRVRGSWTETDLARDAKWPTAGAMCSVWKAPATLSGMSRAFSGGSSANAASCSMVPAATICPGPLSLAAVRPCLSMAARTSSRSPPRTAVIPVGAAAAAPAIALPRSRTSTIACSAVMTRAPVAAVSSADAVPGDRAHLAERVRGVGEDPERRDEARRDQQRLRDLGRADLVGVRFGAVVDEVDAGHGREPLEAGPERVVLQPGCRGNRGTRAP